MLLTVESLTGDLEVVDCLVRELDELVMLDSLIRQLDLTLMMCLFSLFLTSDISFSLMDSVCRTDRTVKS